MEGEGHPSSFCQHLLHQATAIFPLAFPQPILENTPTTPRYYSYSKAHVVYSICLTLFHSSYSRIFARWLIRTSYCVCYISVNLQPTGNDLDRPIIVKKSRFVLFVEKPGSSMFLVNKRLFVNTCIGPTHPPPTSPREPLLFSLPVI